MSDATISRRRADADDSRELIWLLLLFLVLPLALVAVKFADLPISHAVAEKVSLTSLPTKLQKSAGHILFVPMAAVVVVFFRLTLGLRVLGPFRSILLAWAFHSTGIVIGTFFLVLTVGVLLFLRKPIRSLKLPYFGRITIMLSGVAVVMIGFLLLSTWLDANWLQGIAHLPIVVLCLISEAFATTAKKEGAMSAAWRMTATIVVAMLISLLVKSGEPLSLMLHYPELLLLEMGLIVVISRYAAWGWLASWNPGSDDDEDGEEIIGRQYVKQEEPQGAIAMNGTLAAAADAPLPVFCNATSQSAEFSSP